MKHQVRVARYCRCFWFIILIICCCCLTRTRTTLAWFISPPSLLLWLHNYQAYCYWSCRIPRLESIDRRLDLSKVKPPLKISSPTALFLHNANANARNNNNNAPITESSSPPRSYIARIQSRNLAGIISSDSNEDDDDDNDEGNGDIVLQFDSANLCAVSGETGSGKSLLIARAMELLTGRNKATASLILGASSSLKSPVATAAAASLQKKNQGTRTIGEEQQQTTPISINQSAMVEIELVLSGAHLQAARHVLEDYGLSLSIDLPDSDNVARVVLGRTLSLQPVSSTSSSSLGKVRLKSTCHINGRQVTLKALTAFTSPLVTVVNAAMAATALAKPEARLSIVDTGVSREVLREVDTARLLYNRARRQRQRLERELSKDLLPRSFSRDSEQDMEMLQHWIDELDVFERRMMQFCDYVLQIEDENSVLYETSHHLATSTWSGGPKDGGAIYNDDFDDDDNFSSSSSSMYDALMDFRDAIRNLDRQLTAARNALDSLSAFSSPESAVTAIERARSFLFDSVNDRDGNDGKLLDAAERSHELLNHVETALAACARFLEEDEKGLIQTLEIARQSCPIPLEDVDSLILDWNGLARKHGVLPRTLPSCHRALKNERDGSMEARALLPKLLAEEESAKQEFQGCASRLTLERQQVARNLSKLVTDRLPSLGMDRSIFCANVTPRNDDSKDDDTVDFLIRYEEDAIDEKGGGGKVNAVASSGEKARILLAIECALPGSVGASCSNSGKEEISTAWSGLPPIAVVYDEIDAHVGGRAAVAMGSMLIDQSRWSQVVAITHSPSVAAVADTHVVVQRVPVDANSIERPNIRAVKVETVDALQRRKELARMASGDMASKEAEIFAEALIRDGSKVKEVRG